MSHTFGAQAALKQPTNPLSASEPWNLVADGYAETTMLVFEQFWEFMVRGSAPIQMMKKGLGEELWREKEKLALAWLEETLPALKGPLTSNAWLGMAIK